MLVTLLVALELSPDSHLVEVPSKSESSTRLGVPLTFLQVSTHVNLKGCIVYSVGLCKASQFQIHTATTGTIDKSTITQQQNPSPMPGSSGQASKPSTQATSSSSNQDEKDDRADMKKKDNAATKKNQEKGKKKERKITLPPSH